MRQITETVKQLLIINILFFIGASFVGDSAYKLLALYFPENSSFMGWQFISYMFMHANLMHILFNMFALYMFGSALESFWGARKFLFFYISCGIGAALLHVGVAYLEFNDSMEVLKLNGFSNQQVINILNDGNVNTAWRLLLPQQDYNNFLSTFITPAVGASGAIFGLLVAFAFTFPNVEMFLFFIPIPIKAKYLIPAIVSFDLIAGLYGNSIFGGGDSIAHFAHVGGAITGFIITWYWHKNQFNKNRWN